MADVYALVKQVEGRPDGEVTLHGVTSSELVMDTWTAAHDGNFAPLFGTDESPDSEGWTPEV